MAYRHQVDLVPGSLWNHGALGSRFQESRGPRAPRYRGLLATRDLGTEVPWHVGIMGHGGQGTKLDRDRGANSTIDQGRADNLSCDPGFNRRRGPLRRGGEGGCSCEASR